MQQQGGQHGEMGPQATIQASSTSLSVATAHMMGVDNQLVEEASPISSRPPAGNLDELMHDEDEAGDRGGGSGGVAGGSSGNRWPKQETLALLKIRSDMDAAFREAPLKGPLWEDVSRKLAELGYKRSAKKCKEKFENVHKYYKRTKEGRAGRQDGKSYKFFSELEALQTTSNTNTTYTATATASLAMASPHVNMNPSASSSTNFVSLGFGICTAGPMHVSSVHPTIASTRQSQVLPSSTNIAMSTPVFPPSMTAAEKTLPPTLPTQAAYAAGGISFSSNSTSSSHGTEDSEDVEMEEGSSRKRKRASMSREGSNAGSGTRGMMEFFENLMKQVMQKQEAMQQRFLEAIEKREQDRVAREEAWKRQEMARLTREHEIIAQERAIAAQRDAAIITFIQKINGQTIQLPQHASVLPFAAAAVPPASQPAPVPTPTRAAPLPQHQHPPPLQEQVTPQQIQKKRQQSPTSSEVVMQTLSRSTDMVMAVPEQQVAPPKEASVGGCASYEPSSSRWPKEEIIALINLRSGLESRYQEAGPKGPLWEEISAGMARLGYNRSAKRCKEKWENINKYYKKVKESNKQRPEDAKTCPYFHQLDALYRQKLLGNTSSGGGGSSSTSGVGNENRPQQHGFSLDSFPSATKRQDMSNISTNTVQATQPSQAVEAGNKNGSSVDVQTSNIGFPGSLFGEETGKPEDLVKELMDQQQPENHQQLTVDDYDKVDEHDHSDNLDQDDYEDEDDDVELEDQRKMAYKIEFQRQSNAGPPNGGGNGTPSFLAIVQ